MLVLLSQSLLQQGTVWVLGQKTMEKIQMKKKAFSTLSGRCLWFVPFYRQKKGGNSTKVSLSVPGVHFLVWDSL